MNRLAWVRMIISIGIALILAWWVYATHPGWFSNHSSFTLPVLAPKPTAIPGPATPRPRLTPTPAVPRVGTVQHLDDIWITPMFIEESAGANGILPNIGDQFLIVHLHLVNRSQFDFPVRTTDFQVLDSRGELSPSLIKDFTRRRLREVTLIPRGFTSGTLIFEVPLHNPVATLIYQHDPLDPSKRKEWQLP